MQLGIPKTPFRQQDYPIVMAQRQCVIQYTVCDIATAAIEQGVIMYILYCILILLLVVLGIKLNASVLLGI